MTFETLHGDCLKILPTMAADSVDFIFTSPPYERARLYLENGDDMGIARSTEEWVAWLVQVIRECVRVCKGLTAFVVEGQTEDFRYSCGPDLLRADLCRAGFTLRKSPIYRRVGIPGSGGPDWLRNDYEPIVCVTRGGKLPWSDNTACGHPPLWAPGGAMSYRNVEGERKGIMKKTKKVTRRAPNGHRDGDMTTSNDYEAPQLANPGNVIECVADEMDIFTELMTYAYATQTRPDEIVRALRKAISEKTILQWCAGIRAGYSSSALLRPDLHGCCREDAKRDSLSILRDQLPAGPHGSCVLQSGMLRERPEEEAGPGRGRRCGQSQSEATGESSSVRTVRSDEGFAYAPQGRESTEQHNGESADTLPTVSRHISQSTEANYAALLHLWSESGQAVQEIRNTLRQALPAIQEAWVAESQEGQSRLILGDGGRSNLIACKVGGGLMGHPLAHENEAPFPESLSDFFIQSFCPPAGLVLDPFAGSGTTLASAVKFGRRGIGIDVRESQVDLARRRAGETQPQMFTS